MPAKLFSSFLSTTVKVSKDSFVKFDKETDYVNTFIWQFFLDTNKFIMLRKVLKLLMVLSHGQATIKRRFGVNGKLLVESLHVESLIAQKHTHDHIRSYNSQAHNLDIRHELLDPYWKHFQSQKERSLAKENSSKDCQLTEWNEEISKLITEATLPNSAISGPQKSLDIALLDAQKKQTKATALKRAASEKQEELDKTYEKKKRFYLEKRFIISNKIFSSVNHFCLFP